MEPAKYTKLKEFIVEAKANTYAKDGDGDGRVFPDGTRVFEF